MFSDAKVRPPCAKERYNMKKLVIFDLDGTLLDTIEDLGNATNHALRALGFP